MKCAGRDLTAEVLLAAFLRCRRNKFMNSNSYLRMIFPILVTLVAVDLFATNKAKAQLSDPASRLGPYGLMKTYCGSEPIPHDVTQVPWIGCFYLSAGNSAVGLLSKHRIEVAVSPNGEESFKVDGTLVTEVQGPQRPVSGTNVPFARVSGVAGYHLCEDADGKACSSIINIYNRTPDKAILFMVAECLPPRYHTCTQNKEMWEYMNSHPGYQ